MDLSFKNKKIMIKKSFISKSEKDTYKFAAKLAAKLKDGEVLALQGNLGAGKTQFVKGLAKALGIKEHITSPTFVLMKIYKTKSYKLKAKSCLAHIDAYRLESSEDLEAIGALDYINDKNSIVVIEWAEKVKKILPKSAIWINFDYGQKENERKIKIH